jgi:phage repressor protein C with HTH and peptisase S24 domain
MVLNRLKKYIDSKGISVSAFEKSIGMSNASFGKSLKNGGAIGSDKLENILRIYSDLNPIWLLTGEDEMLKGDTQAACSVPSGIRAGIPLMPFSAMAGALRGEQNAMDYECEHYVVPDFRNADFMMHISGDSMVPTFQSGDIVACQRVPMSGLFFQWNRPYILDTDQGAIIKRVKPGSDSSHVLIVSDNREYDAFELEYSQIHAVALVLGIIRLE